MTSDRYHDRKAKFKVNLWAVEESRQRTFDQLDRQKTDLFYRAGVSRNGGSSSQGGSSVFRRLIQFLPQPIRLVWIDIGESLKKDLFYRT